MRTDGASSKDRQVFVPRNVIVEVMDKCPLAVEDRDGVDVIRRTPMFIGSDLTQMVRYSLGHGSFHCHEPENEAIRQGN